MGLPSQVEAAGKRAKELEDQMTETPKAEETPEASDIESPQPEPEKPVPQADNESIESLRKANETLKHRFEVVQGQHKADVKRFKDEVENVKRYNQQLVNSQTELSNTIKELREHIVKPKAEQPAPAPQGFDISKALSQEELDHLEAEDLGGKTLEIFTKLIRAAGGNNSNSVADQFKEQLNQVNAKVDQFGQKVVEREQRSWDERLRAAIPDFYDLNQNPEFHGWLDDTFRRDALQNAINAQDIDALKKGIALFKVEKGKVEVPPKPKKTPVNKPENFIEPDQDFVGTPEGGRSFTIAEVKKFYTDQTKGKWKGREAEAEKINREIVLAEREGRITG